MHKEDFITPNSSLGEGIRCITVSKDNLLNRNFVKEKKEILKELELVIGIPIITMNQVHGACVEEIYTNSKRTIEADALYSSSSDLALGVFTADCLPIAVSYEDGSRFGIIHAGWRGLSKGILDNFLYKFNDSHSDINAWLGPCITKSNYEVGEDVYLSFTEQKEYFTIKGNKKWLFDLSGLATRRLELEKVKTYSSGLCTYEEERLFSFRRNKTSSRMITLVWREK